MKLDLRAPSLVVTGYWNPRIFDEQWVPKNLFGKQPGEFVEVGLIVELPPGRNVPVVFVENVGVRCKKDRLEIFLGDGSPETAAKAEEVLKRAIGLLQHTPMHALGVNFAYNSDEVEAEIADKLKTKEDFEAKHKIISTSFRTAIDWGNEETLNIVRELSGDGVLIELNFHRPVKNSDALLALLGGRIKKKRAEAEGFMRQYYGVADVEVCVHTFSASEGERDDQ